MLKLGKLGSAKRPSSSLLINITLLFTTFTFLAWRLGTIVPGLSAAEAHQRNLSNNLNSIKTNPIDLPYRLLQHFILSTHPHSHTLARLPSLLIAALAVFCIYKLLTPWFGRVIGLFGCLLFISLPIFSLAARQATPDILLFAPVIILYLFNLVIKTGRPIAWILLVISAGLFIYTPGMLWWLIGALVISYKKLSENLYDATKWLSYGLIVGICILIAPLILLLIRNTSQIKPFLLIPNNFHHPLHFLTNLLHEFMAVFINSYSHNYFTLGSMPILNVLLFSLVIFGGYAMWSAARQKTVPLLVSVVFAMLFGALNNNSLYLIFAVPALIIFATAGLRYLYIEWRTIFPINPVPKTFALILIAAVCLSQLYYSFHYTVVAWPKANTTRSAYVLK